MSQSSGYRLAAFSGQVNLSLTQRIANNSWLVFIVLVLFLVEGIIGMQTISARLTNLNRPQHGQVMLPSVAAQPAEPEPGSAVLAAANPPDEPYADDTLQAELTAWQQSHSNHSWSVSVEGITGTGATAGVDTTKTYVTASMFKLFLLYSLADKAQTADLDTIEIKTDKGMQTMGACMDLALRISDNPCGVALGNTLNWQKADKLLRSHGFTTTTLGKSEVQITNTKETAKMMGELYAGATITGTVRERALTALKSQRYRAGIPAGIPGCTVYNKTGDLRTLRHDAAIVDCGSYSYVLSVMTDGAPYAEIAHLARVVNDHMAAAE